MDPWVNLLRGSAQAFSAIMGGVDSIDVLPFDAAVRMPDEFSRRIARNCPLILLGECNLDKVVDPAGGSWYIENLTDEVSRKIWDVFQGIEKEGGIIKALQSGSIQKSVNATAAKRYEMADQRRQSIVASTSTSTWWKRSWKCRKAPPVPPPRATAAARMRTWNCPT